MAKHQLLPGQFASGIGRARIWGAGLGTGRLCRFPVYSATTCKYKRCANRQCLFNNACGALDIHSIAPTRVLLALGHRHHSCQVKDRIDSDHCFPHGISVGDAALNKARFARHGSSRGQVVEYHDLNSLLEQPANEV